MMDLLKRLEPVALVLMVLGGIDLGIVGLFDTNIVTEVFTNTTVVNAIYAVIGLSSLMFVPKILEMLHIDLHRGSHVHGA